MAEELINAHIGPFLNPGLLLAAAASFLVLMSGLGAKIVDIATESSPRYPDPAQHKLFVRRSGPSVREAFGPSPQAAIG